jgi:hypothetical protein
LTAARGKGAGSFPGADGGLWLGFERGAAAAAGRAGAAVSTGAPGAQVRLPAEALLRHVVALGASGSGKTVLAKALVEEAVLRGVPAICIDPQGDLCSLALAAQDGGRLARHGISPAQVAAFQQRADVVVFTPASRKGVPLCIDPLGATAAVGVHAEERARAQSRVAAMIVSLLGYDLDADDGAGLRAVFDQALADIGRAPGVTLAALAEHFAALDENGWERCGRLCDARKVREACRRLLRLDVGARRLLFHEGVPLDVEVLLGRGRGAAATPPGKTRLSVVYLNTLDSQEDKEFFVAALVDRLYAWMLANPSAAPQVLFYVDEVAPFLPPVKKPACKEGLTLLFKQARKYGVACLMATQNPGDVEYRAMAQFGTWALGRLATRQDLKKVEPVVRAMLPDGADDVLAALPALDPGQFLLLTPGRGTQGTIETRTLLTAHETLGEAQIEALADERWRERFAGLESPSAAVAAEAGADRDAAVDPGAAAPKRGSTSRSRSRSTDADTRTDTAVDIGGPPSRSRSRSTDTDASTRADTAVDIGRSPSRSRSRSTDTDTDTRTDTAVDTAGPPSRSRSGSRPKSKSASKSSATPAASRAASESPPMRRSERGRAMVAVAAVDRLKAEAVGRGEARGKFLGVLGEDESFDRADLVHRLVWRVEFEERVERSLLGRLVGSRHELRLGRAYVHPATLALCERVEGKGLVFVTDAGGPLSARAALDTAVPIGEAPAVLVHDDDAPRTRGARARVGGAFRRRWGVAARAVTPVFVPLWRLLLRRAGGAGHRVVTIDAFDGQPVDWPSAPPAPAPARRRVLAYRRPGR